MTRAISLAILALAACSSVAASEPIRTTKYCDLPGMACLDREDAPDDGTDWQELNWCCGYDGTPCVLVTYVSSCDPEGEYVIICDWGASMPDGSIECYE
jgi:hypothetical protein